MNSARAWVRAHAAPLIALSLIMSLYGFSRPPDTSDAERSAMAARFRFRERPLPTLADSSQMFVRSVHPSLAHISAWISSVGAAVALGDLDGDGLSNDLCYVDPRTNLVIVAPVPDTGARYEPFALTPG